MRWSLLITIFFHGSLMAQAEPQAALALEPVSAPYLLKLTAALVLVVGAIFALAWLIKKLNLNQYSHQGLIKIVAGLSVGTRDRIVLLQVGDEQILVGLTPGRIEKIHTLSQPLETDELQSDPTSFAAKFNRLMKDKKPA